MFRRGGTICGLRGRASGVGASSVRGRIVSGVVVRPIAPADYADWRVLWDGYNAFYGRSGSSALPENVVQTTWTRFFDQSEPVHALVAILERRIVGLAHYLFHRSTILCESTCYMQDLFTADILRGRGIGRVLIERVRNDAA